MSIHIRVGDCRNLLRSLPDESVHCCVTSPPYFGLRDYGVAGQIGLEPTPDAFVAEMVAVFREVRRVLRKDGTLWLNLGDSYANDGKWGGHTGGKHVKALHCSPIGRNKRYTGLKPKDLIGVPWMVAFALRTDGWYLRQDVIWAKPNPMPESVVDRCTKAHEYLFIFAKSGDTLLWRHRDSREWCQSEPAPDHIWRHKKTGEEVKEEPDGGEWSRINLWRGYDYFFDADAITEGLQTDPKERYEERARVTGRGEQGAAQARGNDRDRSGGFPPRSRGTPPRHAQYKSSDQSNLDDVGRGGRRNKRSVWSIATSPYPEAHFATFPPALIEPCVLAGCPGGGTVLDPFAGAGTTGLVADRLKRSAILIELNPDYAEMARLRISGDSPLFSSVDLRPREEGALP